MRSSHKVHEVQACPRPSTRFVSEVTQQKLIKSLIGCRHHMQMFEVIPEPKY
jgi:hypothetical protein